MGKRNQAGGHQPYGLFPAALLLAARGPETRHGL